MTSFPSFDADGVKLLVSAVEKTLEHLCEANERLGGSDQELIEAGHRYAILLQKETNRLRPRVLLLFRFADRRRHQSLSRELMTTVQTIRHSFRIAAKRSRFI